ncbi:MAG: hypothetical protein HC824_21795, partial [Synechococcales cyanobacterium RM1_1_8]|nr:hypothetical protein [Synechococcales cyanobacterium RM1_1_8]
VFSPSNKTSTIASIESFSMVDAPAPTTAQAGRSAGITLTEQLLQGAQTLGLPLVDHLILGCGSFTSLRQQTDLWEQYPQGT